MSKVQSRKSSGWTRASLLALIVAMVTPGIAWSASAAAEFKADLDYLTAQSHRLSGTREGKRAADHIERRLKQIGVSEVYPLDMVVWQAQVKRCDLTIEGKTVALKPMRADIIVAPVTPPEGLTRPLIYVGKGELEDYQGRSPEGDIVVLDYGSFDNWKIAFALGADAVIFLGPGEQTPTEPTHAGIPANFIRLYASASALKKAGGPELTRDYAKATIHSSVVWQKRVGRNFVARILGTAPDFSHNDEAVVLAAHYDSFGAVPRLSPSARAAGNVAALLQAAQFLHEHPPKRDMLLMFLDNEMRFHQGSREVYAALMMAPKDSQGLLKEHLAEQAYVESMRKILETQGVAKSTASLNDEASRGLLKALESQSDHARDGVAMQLEVLRLAALEHRGAAAMADRIEPLEARKHAWDEIRRHLHEETMLKFVRTMRAKAEAPAGEEGDSTPPMGKAAEARYSADPRLVVKLLDTLKKNTLTYFEQRLEELSLRVRVDRQREAMLAGLGKPWIVLHVTYNFSGGAPTWGVVVGDWTDKLFKAVRVPRPEGDTPGYYGRVLSAFREAAAKVHSPASQTSDSGLRTSDSGLRTSDSGLRTSDSGLWTLDPQTLSDPMFGDTFAPGPFFSSGYAAGRYGIYNVSLMTGYDARPRDGQPTDTVTNLNWRRLKRQAEQGTALVAQLADDSAISLGRVFRALHVSTRPAFSEGRSSGNYVGLTVTGGLSENHPAAGALLAIWPGIGAGNPTSDAWATLQDALVAPNFQATALVAVNANGHFRMISMPSDMNAQIMALGALFDEQGRVAAITSRAQQAQNINTVMRIDLFPSTGYVFSHIPRYALKPSQLKVLRAVGNAPFRPTRALWGQLEGQSYFYLSNYTSDRHIKIFEPMGPVVLGKFSHDRPFGTGVSASRFVYPQWLMPATAHDLWALNEQRLSLLRAHGVTSADLELLHAKARAAMRQARATDGEAAAGDAVHEGNMPAGPTSASQIPLGGRGGAANTNGSQAVALNDLAEREATLERSAAISQRVYEPLKSSMDDLVHAIVLLLLLAIPFAFALERLLLGATTIYGRIAGFIVMFLITFLILYFTHPGFAIASTPVIIFLAFAIILLSSLVIYIVVRKFRTELKAMQGLRGGLHDLEVSRMGTLLAAVGMGMSTMRRRPMRTTLTAVTVVILTFTILSFASFSRTVGVRTMYQGPRPAGAQAGVLLRKLDYSTIVPGVLTKLRGMAGRGGLISPQWWWVREEQDAPPVSITRADTGQSLVVDAVMGVSEAELPRWPAMVEALAQERSESIVQSPKSEVRGPESEVQSSTTHVPRSTLHVQQALAGGGVFLPTIVRELLHLKAGDALLINGRRAYFAGVFNAAALQRLKRLDGQSVLPVNFQSASMASSGADVVPQNGAPDLLLTDTVEKNFVHLSSNQVIVASAAMVRRLGGDLHAIAIYPGVDTHNEPIDASELGRDMARLVVMPVWAAGREGVERMLFTVLTNVSGGLALFVPLVLGGLIIFGTLLGSITDREREIYTFSALGLSPGHVGVLFFAEAAVYAVVGGMGGQLLAQFVALAASSLAQAGLINPPSINYSSTNALFAIAVVMATVLISAIYPAVRASKSANPGLARAWRMPPAKNDELVMTFPFTVSSYDITGVISFLAEHFRRHNDAGLGSFAASDVRIGKSARGDLQLEANLALAPFDLGVTEHLALTATASEIEGVDEVGIHAHRQSGARGDWRRANKVFMRDLRKQFLLWRTLSNQMIEQYRLQTLQTLGEAESE